MRPRHKSIGNPCNKCGQLSSDHRPRIDRRKGDRHVTVRSGNRHKPNLFLGIDGEGQGRDKHKYVLMGVSDELGEKQWHIESPDGLSTVQCLDFITSLPERIKLFAYAFNYDLTMMLRDLDVITLYKLFRPEIRQGKKGPKPLYWPSYKQKEIDTNWRGYSLNLLNGRFTVKKCRGWAKDKPLFEKATTIHDIWKFFQGKFVSALEDWKIGPKELHERMAIMKSKRSEFDKESAEDIRKYCLEECQCMAALARRLTDAHTDVGLNLKSYFGAGSSASAMLTKMGFKKITERNRKIYEKGFQQGPSPLEMRQPIMSAFFGGRFETSVVGPVKGPIYSWDISSAYPYQLVFLPCLEHGKWRLTNRRDEITGKRAALVNYGLEGRNDVSWGPFPFRDPKGTICYPSSSGGGWLWGEEYELGERYFDGVQFKQAWVYECDCSCQPFKDIPKYYRERLRLGKEGKGIVLKLGCNSCYGKLAQSLGGMGPFTSWIWAGMITSGCRAQMLHVMGLHKDLSKVLSIATDGIASLEDVEMPIPKQTGTDLVIDVNGQEIRKPLGGWEPPKKKNLVGTFFIRPGMSFPLDATVETVNVIRGRGIGRYALFNSIPSIIDSFEKGLMTVQPENTVVRFRGAKSSIWRTSVEGGKYAYSRSSQYGSWIERPSKISFNPMPKRGEGMSVRQMIGVSQAYKKGMVGEKWEEVHLETEEQPNLEILPEY